jgi:hypothetical protein
VAVVVLEMCLQILDYLAAQVVEALVTQQAVVLYKATQAVLVVMVAVTQVQAAVVLIVLEAMGVQAVIILVVMEEVVWHPQ